MNESHQIVRSLLLPLANGESLLVPSAAVAEIISYAAPQPAEGAPSWLVGWMEWRGARLPLVSFEARMGGDAAHASRGRRIVVLNTITGEIDPPFIALVLETLPRPLLVDAGKVDALDTPPPPAVKMKVKAGDVEAMIPDLDTLESEVAELASATA